MSNYTQSGVQAPTELKRSAGCARIRIGSESAKADPNPARKTRERVLTNKYRQKLSHMITLLQRKEPHP